MEYYTKAEIDAMLTDLNKTIETELDDFEHRVDNKIYANDLDVQYIATSYNWSKDNRDSYFAGRYTDTPSEGQALCFINGNHVLQFYSMGRVDGFDSRNACVLMRKFYLGKTTSDTYSLNDAEIVEEIMFDPTIDHDDSVHRLVKSSLCHPSGAFYKESENAIYVSIGAYKEVGDAKETWTNQVVKLDANTYREIGRIDVTFPEVMNHVAAMGYDANNDTIYFQTGKYTAKVVSKTNTTWVAELVKTLNNYWVRPLSHTGSFGVQGICVKDGIEYIIHSRSNCVIVSDVTDGGTRPLKIFGLPETDCYGHYLRYPESIVINPATDDIFMAIWSRLGASQNKGMFFANYIFKTNMKYNVCDSSNIEQTTQVTVPGDPTTRISNADTNYSYPYLNVDSTQNTYTRAYFNGTPDYPFYSLQETMFAAMYRSNKCRIRVKPDSKFDEELSLYGTSVEFDRFFTCNSVYIRCANVKFGGKLKINNTYGTHAINCVQSTMNANEVEFMNGNTTGSLIASTDSKITIDTISGTKTNDSLILDAISSELDFTIPSAFTGDIHLNNTICFAQIVGADSPAVITLSNKCRADRIINNDLTRYFRLNTNFFGYMSINYQLEINGDNMGLQDTGKVFKATNRNRTINVFITDDIYFRFTVLADGTINTPIIGSLTSQDVSRFSVTISSIAYDTIK